MILLSQHFCVMIQTSCQKMKLIELLVLEIFPGEDLGKCIFFLLENLLCYDTAESALLCYDTAESALLCYDTAESALLCYDTAESALLCYDTAESALLCYDTAESALLCYKRCVKR